ncbi:MAG: DUF2278 family protein [Caldilineaceae bacterium]
MPLKNYAVLKGHVIAGSPARPGKDHYAVHVVDDDLDYRIAINVRSQAKNFGPDLWFFLDEDFHHPMLEALKALPLGRKIFDATATSEERRASGVALDFIRMNLFDRTKMKLFPGYLEGAHNDLNERIDDLISDMKGDEENLIYAFGEAWVNEKAKDKIFGFAPGNGVHDIHMNQGDLTGSYAQEDGVYQDGGLILYYAAQNRYVAYFTKFQSQSWHTDDQTGHAISGSGEETEGGGSTGHGTNGGGNPMTEGNDPDFQVRIIAALVNPVGPAPEAETVTLINTTNAVIKLTGWALADKQKNKMQLAGEIAAGETLRVAVKVPLQLSNAGGIITLLNDKGIKIHGVSYTAAQVHREGITLVFGA